MPRALPCSPAKRSKENQGRRLLFGDPPASPEKPNSPGPCPWRGGQETPRSSGPARARLFRQEGERDQGAGWGQGPGSTTLPPPPRRILPIAGTGTSYQQAKRVLHSAVPDRLHAREREMGIIRQFLRDHVCGRRPGSLYISGAPGTGKTACLSRVLLDCKVQGVRQQMRGGMSSPRGAGGAGWQGSTAMGEGRGQRVVAGVNAPIPGRTSSLGAKPSS